MDTTKKKFFLGWLVLGFAQMLALQGCNSGPSGAPDLLFTATPANAADLSESNQGLPATSKPMPGPTRLSLGFFDRSLSGRVDVSSSQEEAAPESPVADVNWKVLPSTLPPPQPGAIADFRDRQGCATYENVGGMPGVQLCFHVVPDISSLALDGKDLEVNGLDSYLRLQDSAGCQDAVYSPAQFVSAEKGTNNVRVRFAVDRSETEACPAGKLIVDFTLQQI